jgi:hypothetical protein
LTSIPQTAIIILELIFLNNITMIKHVISRRQGRNRGQSFVELSLVILILALMLSGVVEFGFLLNNYLKVLDGAREGARFSNMSVPFAKDPTTDQYKIDGGTGYYVSSQTFYIDTAIEAIRVMSPVVLNGNRGDDIVISVFTVGAPPSPTIVRWPYGYASGWRLCDNYTDPALVNDLKLANWSSCTAKSSKFSSAQILSMMDSAAPGSGVLVIEVYYNYPQILKLPVFNQVIPDPIPVYVYAVMPLSAAQPTPGP